MRMRRALRPLAWTVIACVLLVAGWAVFMLADPFAGPRQHGLQESLQRQWRSAPTAPARPGTPGQGRPTGGTPGQGRPTGGTPGQGQTGGTGVAAGQPFALMRVPAFGSGWQFAIVEGAGARELALGPGHVRGTGLPGQPGNFVVAAHDVTAGNPFLHLRELRSPDRVDIYTRDHVYHYVVRSERVVRYTDVSVEYPVPGHPGAPPRRALITLITCTPATLTFTPWRVVVTGELASVSARG